MIEEEFIYVGDDMRLIDVEAVHALGYDVFFKAGKAYIK